jgi:hypothetical protein
MNNLSGDSPQLATTSSITPFDVEVEVQAGGTANGGTTEIPVYDQQEWDVRITLESTYSTAANRRGSDDFILKLRDVCWDLPLTAPLMTKDSGTYTLILWHEANIASRDIPKIDPSNKLSFTTNWVDTYCGGATYELELVTADATTAKATEVDGSGNPIDLSAALNARLPNTHAADGSNLDFSGFFDSTDWVNPSTGIGTWVVRVKATVGTADTNNGSSHGHQ